MSPRGSGTSMADWTCPATTAVVFAALSQMGRIAPSLFASQCTSLAGMCTPARCTCPEGLQR
eukprot:CAMPEP_0195113120 /NCGR_PEP_ID=MMETSP0448-20130528/101339_1 /TAXON_ID=66468 /ORGANISM="Heterocapsa triquestra, Strain CCMP 448" /LENGTH=61 /DNA_ID=CAMNT_0040150019 /DNA_START=45 /DNA_END=227 /DNA_ORIENTATION=-